MNRTIPLRTGLIFLFIFGAAFSRLLPHPPNFTPVGAIALFGAAYFSRKHLALLLPFAALWISDLFLNNVVYARLYPEWQDHFQWFGSPWVYAGFGLIALLGFGLLQKITLPRLLGASVGASILFFLVTNFGAWIGNPAYPQTSAGLFAAYAMGLPFFWNTLAGDLLFTAVLFGAFEWAQRRLPALNLSK